MRASVVGVLIAGVVAVSMGGCGNAGSGATVTQTKTVVEKVPTSSSSGGGSHSGGGSDSGGGSWTMPDETGKDLQGAQDDIQALTDDGVFFTHSHDASGQGRSQILDRDWQVCDQDPRPGDRITSDTKIDFGVVRDTESCP